MRRQTSAAADRYPAAAFLSLIIGLTLSMTSLAAATTAARGVFQSGPDFIAECFASQPSEKKTLWLTDELRQQVSKILGHPIAGLRVRYHQNGSKTAWILEEIGKEMPITIGVMVDNHTIQQVKILAYRESRGGEVRYPAYTRQYQGASLQPALSLSQSIDGITGATLSVWAVNKVAALALYFDGVVTQQRTDA